MARPRLKGRESGNIEAQIMELHNQGKSNGEIWRELGIAQPNFYYYARTLGLTFGKHEGITEEQEAIVRKMHADGKKISEIAEATGRTYSTIIAWLNRNGLRKKTRSNEPFIELEQEEDLSNLQRNTRKPKEYPYEYKGKKWTDITEFYTGV